MGACCLEPRRGIGRRVSFGCQARIDVFDARQMHRGQLARELDSPPPHPFHPPHQIGLHRRVLREYHQRVAALLWQRHPDAAGHTLVAHRTKDGNRQFEGFVRLGDAGHMRQHLRRRGPFGDQIHLIPDPLFRPHQRCGWWRKGNWQHKLVERSMRQRQHQAGTIGLHHRRSHVGVVTAGAGDKTPPGTPRFDQIQLQIRQFQQSRPPPRGWIRCIERRRRLKANPPRTGR